MHETPGLRFAWSGVVTTFSHARLSSSSVPPSVLRPSREKKVLPTSAERTDGARGQDELASFLRLRRRRQRAATSASLLRFCLLSELISFATDDQRSHLEIFPHALKRQDVTALEIINTMSFLAPVCQQSGAGLSIQLCWKTRTNFLRGLRGQIRIAASSAIELRISDFRGRH